MLRAVPLAVAGGCGRGALGEEDGGCALRGLEEADLQGVVGLDALELAALADEEEVVEVVGAALGGLGERGGGGVLLKVEGVVVVGVFVVDDAFEGKSVP